LHRNYSSIETNMTGIAFAPSRDEGLRRLAAFVPRAGHDYTSGRNTDNGADGPAHVSMLSPYLRYRLITEREVVRSVLAHHGDRAADKFVAEVLWRTYWKGWLEMRPDVWRRFVAERDAARDDLADAGMLIHAESGTTGIDGFDDWARQLVETGYLHNHARMWFASIWIFTLRLPWTLGADFFLRHLIDADAASNTLSWRWVAGLQTAGKTYLATAENIERYTGGRYAPSGLASRADPLTEPPLPEPRDLMPAASTNIAVPSLLLITPEDLNPESFIQGSGKFGGVLVSAGAPCLWGQNARAFAASAAADTRSRCSAHYNCPAELAPDLDAETIAHAARAAGAAQVMTPHAPVGPIADKVAVLTQQLAAGGITLMQYRRSWDTRFWPHARRGFFAFKEKIPAILTAEFAPE
jgi:deoxyribodipyrimidine photo-lyase